MFIITAKCSKRRVVKILLIFAREVFQELGDDASAIDTEN